MKNLLKISGHELWVKHAKIGPEISFFCQFLEVGSLVFLEIAFTDSLQQCLIPSRDKTDEKKLGAQI